MKLINGGADTALAESLPLRLHEALRQHPEPHALVILLGTNDILAHLHPLPEKLLKMQVRISEVCHPPVCCCTSCRSWCAASQVSGWRLHRWSAVMCDYLRHRSLPTLPSSPRQNGFRGEHLGPKGFAETVAASVRTLPRGLPVAVLAVPPIGEDLDSAANATVRK